MPITTGGESVLLVRRSLAHRGAGDAHPLRGLHHRRRRQQLRERCDRTLDISAASRPKSA
ncbi:hypothetical protein [Kocuria atrinae]|uniref:hypothetical protein n=1 Tax=Kocuria atrinae TaxID=592377 RepID=UPI001CB99255|nr:hypothetical protein [Kocuria atrinae]